MIIGLVGTKGSGKDTVADYIIEKYDFIKYSLADPMKKAVKEIFLMNDQQLWGDKKEEIDPRYNVSPRKLLQIFGTELFQYDIYKHIPELSIEPRKLWINRFVQWYKEHEHDKWVWNRKTNETRWCFDVVIADVRFPHETIEIKKLGGKIMRIVRFDAQDDHPSETEQKNINEDYTILNDGSIKDLYEKIKKVMNNGFCL